MMKCELQKPGLIYTMLQVESTGALELEYLFVSAMVFWSCYSLFDSLSCQVRSYLVFFFFFILKNVKIAGIDAIMQ